MSNNAAGIKAAFGSLFGAAVFALAFA